MRKLVNFRSFVYSAVLLILSIIACLVALNIAWLGVILLSCIILIPSIIVLIRRGCIEKYKIITVFLTSILCVISSIAFFVKVYTWIPSEIIQTYTYHIEGVIEDCYDSKDAKILTLKNLKIENSKVKGKMLLSVYNAHDSFDDSCIGYKVSFTDAIQLNTLVADFFINSMVLRSDIRYLASINNKKIEVTAQLPDLLSSVNVFIKHKFIDNMGDVSGGIAYGILTGNKNEISEENSEAFSIAGVAHILAVSGLHIGFLMALLMFILKRLRLKRLPSYIISAIVLLLYAFLAGFSPSVTRAVIMCLIGGGAVLFGERKDAFNALGTATTVILTLSPFMLFDVGFVMSVGSVFSIINFQPIFFRGLKKINIPDKLSNSIAISISAQLGILPPSMYFFGTLQTYSVIVNIVLMPLIAMAFIATFIALLISLIPFLSFVLSFAGSVIQILNTAASFCATLPFAQIAVHESSIVMLLYAYYFVIGDFFNAKNKKTIALIGGMLALLVILLLMFL